MAESKTVTSGADDQYPRGPTASLERGHHADGSQAVQQSGKDSLPVIEPILQYVRISQKAKQCSICQQSPGLAKRLTCFVFYYGGYHPRGYRICWEHMTPQQRHFIDVAYLKLYGEWPRPGSKV